MWSNYNNICKNHVNFNNVVNFDVFKFDYNNICKNHVNFNNITNFDVLKSDYIKVCIDHVNFNNVTNFDVEITNFKLWKLMSWSLTLSIFAEILIMICKLFYFSIIVCFATWLLSHDQHIIIYIISAKIEAVEFKMSILQHDCCSWSRYNNLHVFLILLIYEYHKWTFYHLRNF